jgi:hypothetical protein
MFSSEDSSEYTTVKRLERCHADLDNIEIIEELFPFDHAGLDLFGQQLEEVRPLLVTIDPLTAFLDAATKTPRTSITVHEIMTRLKGYAEQYGCAIVCLRHLRKSSGFDPNPIYSGIGDIGIVGKYRSAIQLNKAPEMGPFRVVASHIKSNVGPIGESFAYDITPVNKRDADFTWVGKVEAKAEDFAAVTPQESGQMRDAAEMLKHELASGPRLANDITALAKREGISEKALRLAREKLCGRPERVGFGKDGRVYWRLKDQGFPSPYAYKEVDPLDEE